MIDQWKRFDELASKARPINEADWSSDRQIEAENELFREVEKVVAPEVFEGLEGYCLKATSEERIEAALQAVKGESDFAKWK